LIIPHICLDDRNSAANSVELESTMRTAARHVILLTLVATVLCADRAMTALPAMNQTVAQVAGRVAAKLACNLRRTPRAYRSVHWKNQSAPIAMATWSQIVPTDPNHFAFSPFQYRLPPPSV
jgi:hypothetical protein